MKLMEDYFKEVEDSRRIVYDDSCFVIYAILGEELQIVDAYITPEKRGNGLFKELITKIEDIGREEGCKYLTNTTNTKNVRCLMYQTKNEYKVKGLIQNSLVFFKEL